MSITWASEYPIVSSFVQIFFWISVAKVRMCIWENIMQEGNDVIFRVTTVHWYNSHFRHILLSSSKYKAITNQAKLELHYLEYPVLKLVNEQFVGTILRIFFNT